MLDTLPILEDENLLVGFSSSDDGSVYKLSDDIAIINTLDFFSPIVEDPYTFGKIAATNALSDIYAMGGKPLTCLNIVSYSDKKSPRDLADILRGSAEKVMEAGAVVTGGHSVNDESTKFGISVTGVVHPNKIYKNNGCNIGDYIVITKKLGTGIIMAANNFSEVSSDVFNETIEQMCTLNKYAFDILKKYDVHALTDVTGFGFLGHLNEMVIKSNYSILVNYKNVQTISNAVNLAKDFYITSNGQKNRNFLKNDVLFKNVPFEYEEVLLDPQTSGGLLISVSKDDVKKMVEEMAENGIVASIVGEVVEPLSHNIIVEGI